MLKRTKFRAALARARQRGFDKGVLHQKRYDEALFKMGDRNYTDLNEQTKVLLEQKDLMFTSRMEEVSKAHEEELRAERSIAKRRVEEVQEDYEERLFRQKQMIVEKEREIEAERAAAVQERRAWEQERDGLRVVAEHVLSQFNQVAHGIDSIKRGTHVLTSSESEVQEILAGLKQISDRVEAKGPGQRGLRRA